MIGGKGGGGGGRRGWSRRMEMILGVDISRFGGLGMIDKYHPLPLRRPISVVYVSAPPPLPSSTP